jgi:hypothetical protein
MAMRTDNFRRPAIDAAIDRAVRDMMQIDPLPGMRHRVLGRIQRRASSFRVLGFHGWKLAFAAAALVAIGVAAAVLRPTAPSPSPTALSQFPPAPSPSSTALSRLPTAPSPPSTAPPPSRFAPARATVFGPRRDRVSAATVDTAGPGSTPVDVDELAAGVPRLVVTPLRQVTDIQVAPLAIRPIAIQPLLTPRGDR